MAKFLQFITILVAINCCICAKFPSDIPQCKAGDTTCLSDVITKILHSTFKGHRGLNLIPFDPLRLRTLVLEKNPTSPVNIELKFSDVDLIGIKTAIVQKTIGFGKDPKNTTFEIRAKIPKLELRGPYSINGRVLILPIVGKGNSVILFENVDIILKLATKVIEKKGKFYLHVQKSRLDLNPERMEFKLENLFNGDKALGDNMNLFINDNWRDIFMELKPSIVKAIDIIIVQIANGVFEHIPYAELLL